MINISVLRAFTLFALVSAASCARDAADTPSTEGAASPSAAASRDEVLKPVTEYELTMPKVDQYFEAQRNMASAAAAMSPAERQAIKDRAEAEEEAGDGAENDESVEAMGERFERHPVFGPAIRKAGLSHEEYATITLALLQAGMAEAVLAMRPNDNQDSLAREMQVNPRNLVFMRENKDVLTRKGEALAAEMKAAGLTED